MNTQLTSPAATSLTDLAAAAKSDRNRAVDAYRAVAMGAVAAGHWMAIAIGRDDDGGLITGNALTFQPSLGWVTWLFQVMPLFFVVGGFSSAMSLDASAARNGRDQDWVVARLRRMVSPAMVLAATWLGLLVFGTMFDAVAGTGLTPLLAAGAIGAAIPLWFLANYTIDTAIAPYLLPLFRRLPVLVAGAGLAAFAALEAIRLADLSGLLHYLPYTNWVLGWLLFQVMGFAWRDGLLPTGRQLAAIAVGLWALAIGAVALGPWPMAMVHFPGVVDSPTHPPSLALMLFGAAYSATALVFAPAVSSILARRQRAWAAVVGANSMAMSVYLWHLSAAAIAGALFYGLGWLPTAEVGTGLWWLQKLPLMTASLAILAAIVSVVARFERNALLAERTPWHGGPASMFATAIALSVGLKLWANPNIAFVVAGMVIVSVLWLTTLTDGSKLSVRTGARHI
ncbi:MAG: acyltransferase [Actinomycetia bacterium]|nr:acyltransferase [Actinomycetes bacterium]